jgi:hypothetical protein
MKKEDDAPDGQQLPRRWSVAGNILVEAGVSRMDVERPRRHDGAGQRG